MLASTSLSSSSAIICEDYLPELLTRHRGRGLRFSSDLAEAVHHSQLVMIAVGTPPDARGMTDVSCIEAASREIARADDDDKVIVAKSTVPIHGSIGLRRMMQLNSARAFDIVSNPEFLREGSAITDFLYPDRIVIGSESSRASDIMRELYAPLLDGGHGRRADAIPRPSYAKATPVYLGTSPATAELIKHASNAFLATKISFINAVAAMAVDGYRDTQSRQVREEAKESETM